MKFWGVGWNKLQQNFSQRSLSSYGQLNNILKVPKNPIGGTSSKTDFKISNITQGAQFEKDKQFAKKEAEIQ